METANSTSHSIVGLLALDIDATIETDLRSHLIGEDIEISTNRMVRETRSPDDPYRDMNASIELAVKGLLPTSEMDAIVFGCTSAAMTLGVETIREIIGNIRPGVPVIDPASACISALSQAGIERIGLITPYSKNLHAAVRDFLVHSGFQVRQDQRFELDHNYRYQQPKISDYVSACRMLANDSDIDGIFISCTALSTASVLSVVQEDIKIPVFSSNQVVANEIKLAIKSAKKHNGN